MTHLVRTETPLSTAGANPQVGGSYNSFLHRLQRRATQALCAGTILLTLFAPVHADEPPEPAEPSSLQAAETPASTSTDDQGTVDPFIELRGSVWRTKAGIVFLKTPVGLLTLTSKTTLKDLKASQEVHFWVHERHFVVEIRKRDDGSLVHRYLSGPMTSGTDMPKTLHCWAPDGDQIVHVDTQDNRFANYREGDALTVEVDETNTIRGVHDLQFDLQISQSPPAGAKVQLLLSGTVSKLKSNFVFIRTPIGLIMLNSKIGVPRVKVGQPLTLHIDNEHVTVTVSSDNETPPSRHNSASPTP